MNEFCVMTCKLIQHLLDVVSPRLIVRGRRRFLGRLRVDFNLIWKRRHIKRSNWGNMIFASVHFSIYRHECLFEALTWQLHAPTEDVSASKDSGGTGRQFTLIRHSSHTVVSCRTSSFKWPNHEDFFLILDGFLWNRMSSWPTLGWRSRSALPKSFLISWSIFWSNKESTSGRLLATGYVTPMNSWELGAIGPKSRWKKIHQSTPRAS